MVEIYNLKEEINKYLDSKKSIARDRDYFYVSEIGKSKKEIYEDFIHPKSKKFDARVMRLLENGNKVHERFMKIFAEMGILVCAEVDAVSNDLVHGRLDAIITDRKQNYVVEIKSINMWSFNKLKEPMFNHKLQIQFYMYYTNIPRGFILYEDKNTQEIKYFYLDLDKKLVEGYIKELKVLKENINKKIEPENKPIKLEDIEYGT